MCVSLAVVWFVVLSLFLHLTLRHNAYYCMMLTVYGISSCLNIVTQKSGSGHMTSKLHQSYLHMLISSQFYHICSRLAHERVRHFECLAVSCDCFHNLQIGVFWEVLLCNQAGIFPHFRGLSCHAFDMEATDSS